MTVVLDASAALAFLQGEQGAQEVETHLENGAVIGAANWSEVAQKVIARTGSWTVASTLLDSYQLEVESVTRADSELAAAMWQRGNGLPLGDRLCLALASRLALPVLTADAQWGDGGALGPTVHQIR